MRIRNRETGAVKEVTVLSMIAGLLSGKIRAGKAPGFGNRTIRGGKKPGRNEPCPCGSETKYKRCCGETEQQKQTRVAAAARHRGDYEWNI